MSNTDPIKYLTTREGQAVPASYKKNGHVTNIVNMLNTTVLKQTQIP